MFSAPFNVTETSTSSSSPVYYSTNLPEVPVHSYSQPNRVFLEPGQAVNKYGAEMVRVFTMRNSMNEGMPWVKVCASSEAMRKTRQSAEKFVALHFCGGKFIWAQTSCWFVMGDGYGCRSTARHSLIRLMKWRFCGWQCVDI